MDIQLEEIQRRIGALILHVWALEEANARLAERVDEEHKEEDAPEPAPPRPEP